MGADGAVEYHLPPRARRLRRPRGDARRADRRVPASASPTPTIAAARGFIDDVIEPRETRAQLIRALEMLHNKREADPPQKHGNIPL